MSRTATLDCTRKTTTALNTTKTGDILESNDRTAIDATKTVFGDVGTWYTLSYTELWNATANLTRVARLDALLLSVRRAATVVHLPAPAQVMLMFMACARVLGIAAVAAAAAVVLVGCEPKVRLLVQNDTSEPYMIRVAQDEVSPLVFEAGPHTRAWAVHIVDGLVAKRDISLLTIDCRIVGTWRSDGSLVIRPGGNFTLDSALPASDELPSPNARLPRTERCGRGRGQTR